MRGSLSNLKNIGTQDKDKRTTKTKASASKPTGFSISLARNKNKANPILFGSVKKQMRGSQFVLPFNSQKYNNSNNKPIKLFKVDIFEQLNNRVSIDFINSLYTDLLVRMGHELQKRVQMKENFQMNNINVNVNNHNLKNHKNAEKSDEIDLFITLKQLIELKDKVNKSYRHMQNSRNLFLHVIQNKRQILQSNVQQNQTDNEIKNIHKVIYQYLQYTDNQSNLQNNIFVETLFKKMQQKYVNMIKEQKENQKNKKKKQNSEQQGEQNDEQIDKQIALLKSQLNKQKRLTQRFKKQQIFLMNRLYSTQRKNSQLQTSCSTLQIKNLNLRENLRFSQSLDLKTKKVKPQQPIKRSMSVKLLKIRRYNINNQKPLIQQQQSARSSSRTSLINSSRLPLIKLNNNHNHSSKHKLSYFDRIH